VIYDPREGPIYVRVASEDASTEVGLGVNVSARCARANPEQTQCNNQRFNSHFNAPYILQRTFINLINVLDQSK
jgi:hypothetical protein